MERRIVEGNRGHTFNKCPFDAPLRSKDGGTEATAATAYDTHLKIWLVGNTSINHLIGV